MRVYPDRTWMKALRKMLKTRAAISGDVLAEVRRMVDLADNADRAVMRAALRLADEQAAMLSDPVIREKWARLTDLPTYKGSVDARNLPADVYHAKGHALASCARKLGIPFMPAHKERRSSGRYADEPSNYGIIICVEDIEVLGRDRVWAGGYADYLKTLPEPVPDWSVVGGSLILADTEEVAS